MSRNRTSNKKPRVPNLEALTAWAEQNFQKLNEWGARHVVENREFNEAVVESSGAAERRIETLETALANLVARLEERDRLPWWKRRWW